MKKKVFNIFTILFCLSLIFNNFVFAEEIITESGENKQISIRIEGIDSTVIVTPEGYSTSAITALDAIKELLDSEEIPYELEQTQWGTYIKSINGETEGTFGGYDGWMFAINGAMASVGVDTYKIEEGDEIFLFYGDFVLTSIPQVSINAERIVAGVPFEINLEYTYHDWDIDEDVTLKLSNTKIIFDGEEYYTDENGTVVITPQEAGTYILEISKVREDGFPEVARTQKVLYVLDPVSYLGDIDEEIHKTIEFYRANVQDLSDWDFNWWDIVALVGVEEEIDSGIYSLPQWPVEDFSEELGILDYVHYIYAGAAMGYDPQDWDGRDLIAELASEQQEDGSFGKVINFHMWAMITLDAFDGDYNQDAALAKLLESQHSDGGFGLGSDSDVDVTTMALIALSNYKEDAEVLEAINKAADYLKSRQAPSGGFVGEYGENSNSTALVVSALIAIGEDIFSDAWKENERNPLEGLLSYRLESNGFYYSVDDADSVNLMATSQALIALGDVKYNKSVFKRIAELELEPITPPDDNNPGTGGGGTGGGGSSSSKSIYLKVTGDSEKGVIYSRKKVTINNNDTPYSVLKREVGNVKVVGTGDNLYVKGIDGLEEFDRGPLSGWKYTINGKEVQESAGKYKLKDGDELHWFYYEEEKNNGGGRTTGVRNNSSGGSAIVINEPSSTEDKQHSEETELEFSDWSDISDWAVEYIQKGLEQRIIKGDTNSRINPKARITRAELATMLVRLKGLSYNEEEAEEIFLDVDKEKWFYKDVMTAYQANIVKGKSHNLFEPDSLITREEMAVMIFRIIEDNTTFKAPHDIDKVSEWAKEAVEAVFGLEIMVGDGTNFQPADYVTREMAVKTLVSLCEGEYIQ